MDTCYTTDEKLFFEIFYIVSSGVICSYSTCDSK